MSQAGWIAPVGTGAPERAVPLAAEGIVIRWDTLAPLLAAAFALLWAAGMASLHQAPPADSAEQLVWSYAAEGGYWKHPPLPSWILHALVRWAGPSLALPFFVTQAGIAIALLVLWRLGREWMGPGRSLLAMALTALVGYHGWCADAFNHNSALLPFQAATAAAFWFAVRRGRWAWWVAVGVCAGLGMLVKYVAVLPLAGLLLYVALDREARTVRTFAGIALAGLVALFVVAPHLWWLQQHGWIPLHYARGVAVPLTGAGSWALSTSAFAGSQLLRLAPMLVVLAWMAWTLRRSRATAPAPALARRDRLFLWTVGTVPLVLTMASALAAGSELLPRWGYNAFLFSGWLVVDALRWPRDRVPAALRVCVLAQVVLWATAVVLVPAAARSVGWQGRSNFPGAQFANEAHAVWAERTSEPLRIVIADTWLGGTLVAFTPGRHLAVLAEGDEARAPWVTAADVEACGALVVQDRSAWADEDLPAVSRWLARADESDDIVLPWAPSRGFSRPHAGQARIAWGFLAPQRPSDCRL